MAATNNSDLTDIFIEFFNRYYSSEITELTEKYPDEQRSLLVSYEDLERFSSDLAEDFVNHPEQLTEYAEEALRLYETSNDAKLGQAHVRIKGLPNTVSLENIRSEQTGDLIQIRGTVSGTSKVQSELTEVAYECQRCGTMTYIPQRATQRHSDLNDPHECQGCERQGPFRKNVEQSEMVDVQTVVLEQQIRGIGGSDDVNTIELFLRDDLAGVVNPGDTILVTGVLKHTEDALETTIPDKYVTVNNIENSEPNGHLKITDDDELQFREIASRDSLFDDLIDSIAPSLYGYRQEKLAVALQLAGGVVKRLPDGTRTRGDIHLLYIGDPGTGKSVLARSAARLAPRAVTVSGTDASKVGLTASATPSSGSADPWEVKGGALVRANHGLAVIDNIDGFGPNELAGLHATIEDQEVNVSKASVTATLPAQSAVFAAMNPKYGKFDMYEPVASQVDLSPDIISQFDLIFTLTDEPDRDQDKAVADHILDTSEAAQKGEPTDGPAEPTIAPEQLRKYFSYTKRRPDPELTEEAKIKIRDFYVDIRSKSAESEGPLPITARKLEAIVRLAEASARLRLSDEIREEDAERAVGLVESCLLNIGVYSGTDASKTNAVDSNSGNSQDGRYQTEDLKQVLDRIETEHEQGIPEEVAVSEITDQYGLSKEKAEHEIEKLRRLGMVYEPSSGFLRTT